MSADQINDTLRKSGDAPDVGVNTRLAHIGHSPRDYHGFVNVPVVRASTVLLIPCLNL